MRPMERSGHRIFSDENWVSAVAFFFRHSAKWCLLQELLPRQFRLSWVRMVCASRYYQPAAVQIFWSWSKVADTGHVDRGKYSLFKRDGSASSTPCRKALTNRRIDVCWKHIKGDGEKLLLKSAFSMKDWVIPTCGCDNYPYSLLHQAGPVSAGPMPGMIVSSNQRRRTFCL